MVETVDHPTYYNQGQIEVIDFIQDQRLNFTLGNAVKYITRAAHKGESLQDLEKALWYLQDEINRIKFPGLTSKAAQAAGSEGGGRRLRTPNAIRAAAGLPLMPEAPNMPDDLIKLCEELLATIKAER